MAAAAAAAVAAAVVAAVVAGAGAAAGAVVLRRLHVPQLTLMIPTRRPVRARGWGCELFTAHYYSCAQAASA